MSESSDIAGLREQINANLTALGMPELTNSRIVISRPVGNRKYTGWILINNGQPMIKGRLLADSVEAALNSLLEVTTELVAEKLASRFQEYEERSREINGNGLVLLEHQNKENGHEETETGDEDSTMMYGRKRPTLRERTYTSESGHECVFTFKPRE